MFNFIDRVVASANRAIVSKQAEDYVDTAVKILIAVVLGALLLAGLYSIFKLVVLPKVNSSINDLFAKAGTDIGKIDGAPTATTTTVGG